MIEGYRLIPNERYISYKYLNDEHNKIIICDLIIKGYRLFPKESIELVSTWIIIDKRK